VAKLRQGNSLPTYFAAVGVPMHVTSLLPQTAYAAVLSLTNDKATAYYPNKKSKALQLNRCWSENKRRQLKSLSVSSTRPRLKRGCCSFEISVSLNYTVTY